jgi:hypothetical protein
MIRQIQNDAAAVDAVRSVAMWMVGASTAVVAFFGAAVFQAAEVDTAGEKMLVAAVGTTYLLVNLVAGRAALPSSGWQLGWSGTHVVAQIPTWTELEAMTQTATRYQEWHVENEGRLGKLSGRLQFAAAAMVAQVLLLTWLAAITT